MARLKVPNKKIGKTILVTILDSYQEYCSLGYPKDPKVYVVRANKETISKISNFLNLGIISKKDVNLNWGFRLEEDSSLPTGHIVFGPEQVIIKWDGK